MKNRDNDKVYKLVLTALMAALCYVAFTFLKFRSRLRAVILRHCISAMHSVFSQPCFLAADTVVWQVPWV